MKNKWMVLEWDCEFFVATDDYVHPISFDSERDANRACARLNARDNKIDPVPYAHWDEH